MIDESDKPSMSWIKRTVIVAALIAVNILLFYSLAIGTGLTWSVGCICGLLAAALGAVIGGMGKRWKDERLIAVLAGSAIGSFSYFGFWISALPRLFFEITGITP